MNEDDIMTTIFTFEDEVNEEYSQGNYFEEDNEETSGEELENGSIELGSTRILKVRLDKWLWAARFFKTRPLARAAVENGKVFYNGQRSKPTREIEVGAILQIRIGRLERTVTVAGLSTRRHSTEKAEELYQETEESKQLRAQQQQLQSQTTYFPNPNTYLRRTESTHQTQNKVRKPVRFLRRSFAKPHDAQENIDPAYSGNSAPIFTFHEEIEFEPSD
ncbi:MAG: hypothetical protein JWM09_1439 [Francisellaceae bacterium]|nr:hypothetical protein [Francisellaceae bacterium]